MDVGSTPRSQEVRRLAALLGGRRVVVLTGAGLSTGSGIPDYRGPQTRQRARNPVQYRAFVGDAEARRRYWARAVVGWPRFAQARPNPAHTAIAELEAAGAVVGVITQNVDRLHHAAGSRRVVELHGALHEVCCLGCGRIEPRESVQHRLLALNPGWSEHAAELAPDGDAELPDALIRRFQMAACSSCDGVLKPHVVFFGETVPRAVVDAAFDLFARAEALLVLGSSLAVFSGYRFVRAAARSSIPVAIVNLGPTRGDPYAQLRVEADLTELLPAVAASVGSGASAMV